MVLYSLKERLQEEENQRRDVENKYMAKGVLSWRILFRAVWFTNRETASYFFIIIPGASFLTPEHEDKERESELIEASAIAV
ncbi:hypothetical protein KQX54_002356 [Cotesia glomerata]|uniref:Uncharacterized protein n=1 Tax=Cotesia glomerata TaxID=32391 RepID=A0AAV7IAW1_COTGL|nr:hypothetical protein KQX54_002356 [Cotesia glomerata]